MTIHCSLLTVHCFLFTADCSPLTETIEKIYNKIDFL